MSSQPPEIDLVIVSGRRPDLLERTLESFQQNLLSHASVANCYANIDPFAGDDSDLDACKMAITSRFPRAVISAPSVCGFGTAVKSLWSQVTSDYFLHLEDDWLLLETLNPDDVISHLTGMTASARLVSKELGWDGSAEFRERTVREKSKRGVVERRVSSFTLGPAFFTRDFAKGAAALMRPELDPEKQFLKHFNAALGLYSEPYRCRIIGGCRQPELVQDIGRVWRETHRITKHTGGGKSTWVREIDNAPEDVLGLPR